VTAPPQTTTLTTTVGGGQVVTTTVTSPPVTQTITAPGAGTYAVAGATPAERAVNGIKLLREQGRIPDGARLKFLEVAFRQGNMTPAAGSERRDELGLVQGAVNMLELWESQTGIPVDMDLLNDLELFEKAISEGVTRAGTWDIMSQRIDFLHDFIGADAIIDATELDKKYGGEFDTGPCPVIRPAAVAYRTGDGKLWGFPGCGDWFNLYIRHDLLANATQAQKSDFESRYGYPLPVGDVPLWSQIRDLAEFWDHYTGVGQELPDGTSADLRGGYFFRDPWFSNIELYVRFNELGGLYMDDSGQVTLDVTNRFGVNALRTALEGMKSLIPFQSPEAFRSSWPTMYPDYGQRKVFASMSWASLAQFAIGPTLSSRQIGVYHIPGYAYAAGQVVADRKVAQASDTLIRSTVLYDQTSYVLDKWGPLTQAVPDVPYLFMQWLSDPNISAISLANPGAISDHFRTCHATDFRLIRTFAARFPTHPVDEPGRRGAMEMFDVTLPGTVTPMLFAGLKEIQDLQGTQINAYCQDLQTLGDTATNIQRGVQEIVDRKGRELVAGQFQAVKANFPPSLKQLHGF
jgi:hypothetical protein